MFALEPDDIELGRAIRPRLVTRIYRHLGGQDVHVAAATRKHQRKRSSASVNAHVRSGTAVDRELTAPKGVELGLHFFRKVQHNL